MNVEEQLAGAMRQAAETTEPPVADLVGEGVARGRRRRMRHRMGAVAAAAAVTAAAVTAVAVVGGPGGGTVAPRPPVVHLVSATEVLDKAALAAEAQPAGNPRQWMYERTVEFGIGTEQGMRPVTSEYWYRLDGTQEAGFQGGKLVVDRRGGPAAASGAREIDYLRSLPVERQALRAAIYKRVDAEPRRDRVSPDRDGQAFSVITQLLWSHPTAAPPKTLAALYRTIATIPGVRVDRNVKDGAGRPAVAVTHGHGEQFLLDPATYRVIGQRTVGNGRNAPISKTRGVDPRFQVPAGTVTYSLTRLTAKVVDRPGLR